MINHDRAESLRNITVVMDVVRGWVTLVRGMGHGPCLFSYLSYKEENKNGQLGDRFTAGYRGGI